jgi:hypothetical protein
VVFVLVECVVLVIAVVALRSRLFHSRRLFLFASVIDTPPNSDENKDGGEEGVRSGVLLNAPRTFVAEYGARCMHANNDHTELCIAIDPRD